MKSFIIECDCGNILELQDLIFEKGEYKCKYCNSVVEVDDDEREK